MAKLFSFIALLVLVNFFQSCKKGQASFELKGTITDATFSQGLGNCTITIYKYPVGSTQKTKISSIQSTDGTYSFTFPRDKSEKFEITVYKENYFELSEIVYFGELSIDEPTIRNYTTTAKSWAKLTFVNQNPSATDDLKYIKQQGKMNCIECCPSNEQHLLGAQNTSILCINDGNTTYSYYYWLLNTSNQGLKEVYTTAFDTTEVLLTY